MSHLCEAVCILAHDITVRLLSFFFPLFFVFPTTHYAHLSWGNLSDSDHYYTPFQLHLCNQTYPYILCLDLNWGLVNPDWVALERVYDVWETQNTPSPQVTLLRMSPARIKYMLTLLFKISPFGLQQLSLISDKWLHRSYKHFALAQLLETTYWGQVVIQTRLYQMFVFFSFTTSKPQNLNTVKSNHRSHQETQEWKIGVP